MRICIRLTIFMTVLTCVPLMGAAAARAGDRQDGFSLGYGSLTPSRTDPRAQQFGQLVARYRLSSSGNFKPYLGTGLGISYQPDLKPDEASRIRTGVAGQAGFSYLLGEKSALTFDYKFLDIGPDRSRDRGTATPQSIGVGLEIKF